MNREEWLIRVHAARGAIAAMAAVSEPAMRRATLIRRRNDMNDEDFIVWLDAVLCETVSGDADARTIYQSLYAPEWSLDVIGEDAVERCRWLAQEGDCVAASQWIWALHNHRPCTANDVTRVHREFESMTLGDRRALARKAKGLAIDKLILDPDPTVVEHLLRNPQTTEELVLRLASRRPHSAVALVPLFHNVQWTKRYRVKLSLARNPSLPASYATGLIPLLKPDDQKSIRDDATLDSMVRLAAQRYIQAAHRYRQLHNMI